MDYVKFIEDGLGYTIKLDIDGCQGQIELDKGEFFDHLKNHMLQSSSYTVNFLKSLSDDLKKINIGIKQAPDDFKLITNEEITEEEEFTIYKATISDCFKMHQVLSVLEDNKLIIKLSDFYEKEIELDNQYSDMTSTFDSGKLEVKLKKK